MSVIPSPEQHFSARPVGPASVLAASTDEFLVNTVTTQDQFDPAVIALAGGGYAVVWSSGSASQSSSVEIRAQVLDANGAKVGTEILIDSSTDTGRDIRLEALTGGGFVVTWDDNQPGDGGASTNGALGVKAQIVSAAGVKVGPDISVNTITLGAQTGPDVTALADGKFVIVWSDRSEEVKGQVFAADGTPVGGEFVVNATNSYEQSVPKVTALQDGGFVVTWQDYSAAGPPSPFFSNDSQVDVRAQYFDSLGARVGLELLVNTTTPARQDPKDIITLDNGNVLIVWNDWSTGTDDVRAQILGPTGARVGTEVLVNTTTQGGQGSPLAVALPGGGFAITWLSNAGGASTQMAQVFAANGSPIGGEIAAGPDASFGTPAIVRLPGDEFAISWVKGNSFGTTDIWMQVYGADGTRHGDSFIVNQHTDGPQIWSGLAAGADGRLLATWRDGTNFDSDPAHVGTDVKGRLFGPPTVQSGTESADVLTGTPLNDVLDGRGGDDSLSGLGGSDFLIGGTGNDAMAGGAGNDTYYVDSPGDVVTEAVGEGNDRIAASVSYRIADGAEVETLEAITLADTTPLNLAGNEFANRVIGNNGANLLDGGAGDDQLEGGGGGDFLIGGAGVDRMYGGAGDDTFYAADADDHVFELAGEGNDRVAAIVSYALTAGSEIETLEAVTLTDLTPLQLTGNELANRIIGNDGANRLDGAGGNDTLLGLAGDDQLLGGGGNDVLDGGAGADAMTGGAGNDTYYVDAAGDSVDEATGGGADRIATSVSVALAVGSEVERLEALDFAGTNALDLVGNQFAQTIIGNQGANMLDGKGGADVLIGAGGADTFAFTTALGAANVDAIADFASGTDKIALDDAVFTGLMPGALPAGAFVTGSAAGDADDRIIYNSATGQLFFDADGNGSGAAVLFATLDGHPPVAASDFTVI